MNFFDTSMACILGFAILTGCASSEITQRQYQAGQEQLPRPGRIIVYDFNATESDIPPTAAITGSYSQRPSPQTSQEIQVGRKLGALVAQNLVRKILDMGMPAQRARKGPAPQIGDVLITGQFIKIDEGDRTKRVLIGFGKGGGELKTHVEGYLVTESGNRLLGTRQVGTKGGKKPGALLPGIVAVASANPAGLIVSSIMSIKGEKKEGSETLEGAAKRTAKEIAKELERIFRRQGWI